MFRKENFGPTIISLVYIFKGRHFRIAYILCGKKRLLLGMQGRTALGYTLVLQETSL